MKISVCYCFSRFKIHKRWNEKKPREIIRKIVHIFISRINYLFKNKYRYTISRLIVRNYLFDSATGLLLLWRVKQFYQSVVLMNLTSFKVQFFFYFFLNALFSNVLARAEVSYIYYFYYNYHFHYWKESKTRIRGFDCSPNLNCKLHKLFLTKRCLFLSIYARDNI